LNCTNYYNNFSMNPEIIRRTKRHLLSIRYAGLLQLDYFQELFVKISM